MGTSLLFQARALVSTEKSVGSTPDGKEPAYIFKLEYCNKDRKMRGEYAIQIGTSLLIRARVLL